MLGRIRFVILSRVEKRLSIYKIYLRYASNLLDEKLFQAIKSCWWMPWHREATKDAPTCDKLWGAGKRL